MSDLFRNLIKLCRFTKGGADDKQFPIQQVDYLDKTVDVFVIMPYGSHANIPADFLGVLAQISTQEQNRVVIPLSQKNRPKPIESGEVVYFHPVTGSKIHFKNDGGIISSTDNATSEIKDDGSIKGDNPNGSFELQADGDFVVNGVTIDPSGNIVTAGTINADDVTADNADVTLSTHTHSSGSVPAPDAGS